MGSEKPDPFDGTLRQIENHARAARGELAVLNAELSALRAENARLREALERTVHQIRCEDNCEGLKRDFIGNRYEYRKCSCGADEAFEKSRAALGGKR